MKIKHKAFWAAAGAIAVISTAALGTMAYFTDKDAVTNTFTVGHVGLTLDEKDVDNSKTGVTTEGRDKANSYHLLPGEKYEKDPTIHISKDSESCWLFVKIENDIANIIDMTDFNKQLADNGWSQLTVDGEAITNVYTHAKYEKGGNKDIVVFESFTVNGKSVVNPADGETVADGNYDLKDYAKKNINVTAYAIQADGFDTAAEAWKAEFTETDQ